MSEEITCVWVWDTEEGACGEPSEVYQNLPLCEEHKQEFTDRRWKYKGSTARQAAGIHPLEAFPGWCYIVLLPDTTVKIGYSNTDALLENRLKTLKRELGNIVLLAKIPGGFVTEAVLHEKFWEHRVSGVSERFKYGPEIAEYITSLEV